VEAGLDRLAQGSHLARGRRGRGLLQALVLTAPCAGEVVAAALDAGLIINAVRPDAVRLAPPLTLTDAELDELLARLGQALAQVESEGRRREEVAT
jgi:acetylornithine aminotransferase